MRRLIVEFDLDVVADVKRQAAIKAIETMHVITFLKTTPEEIALICRVKFKDPNFSVEDVFADSFDEIQVLERDRDGSITCYFRGSRQLQKGERDLLGPGVYLSPPYEVREGRIRGTFLANDREIRRILRVIGKAGVPYRVVSLMDAKFSPDSPLAQLTEKQRRVMLTAFKLGYYDSPRGVSSRELARHLNVQEPTVVRHRRKAERRLLSAMLGQQ